MFVKTVTAETAAEEMGGFSTPYLHTCFYESLSQDEATRHFAYCSGGGYESANDLHAAALVAESVVLSATERVLFWTHTNSVGHREMVTDPGAEPVAVVPDGDFGDWVGWDPKDVKSAFYASAFSGSGMRYTRDPDSPLHTIWGELEFIESPEKPTYRGSYFDRWYEAEEFVPQTIGGSVLVHSAG